MLSGKPPFNGPNDRVIFNKIIRGTYNFSGLEWVNISQDAKNLINKMLTLNPA